MVATESTPTSLIDVHLILLLRVDEIVGATLISMRTDVVLPAFSLRRAAARALRCFSRFSMYGCNGRYSTAMNKERLLTRRRSSSWMSAFQAVTNSDIIGVRFPRGFGLNSSMKSFLK